jgi:hypothetical protein
MPKEILEMPIVERGQVEAVLEFAEASLVTA